MERIVVIEESDLKKLIKDSISPNGSSSSDEAKKAIDDFVKRFANFTKNLNDYLDKEFKRLHDHLTSTKESIEGNFRQVRENRDKLSDIQDRLFKIQNKLELIESKTRKL